MNVPCDTHPGEDLDGGVGLGVKEVQHVAGVLDAVLGSLLGGGEAVVTGTVEIFETGGTVFQLVGLSWHDGLLLGHTGREAGGLVNIRNKLQHCDTHSNLTKNNLMSDSKV